MSDLRTLHAIAETAMPDELAHPPILTVAEVAHYLRVSETTIWRWCISGKLPAFRVGRGWRVRRGDLDLMIAEAQPQSKPGGASPANGPHD